MAEESRKTGGKGPPGPTDRDAGIWRGRKLARRFTSPDGFVVLVGKSAEDNDLLSSHLAEPADFWFHLAGDSGSHVVVRNPDRIDRLPRETERFAAALAAGYSKAKNAGRVAVHACRFAVQGDTAISYNQTGSITVKATASDIPNYSKLSNVVSVLAPFAVSSVSPAENATNVSTAANVRATFNRSVNTSTVNSVTFFLTPSVYGTYSVSGSTATFTPSVPLAYSTTYTATMTTAATDTYGFPLASTKTWSFTTTPAPAASVEFNPPLAGPVLVNSPWAPFAVRVLKSDGSLVPSFPGPLFSISGRAFVQPTRKTVVSWRCSCAREMWKRLRGRCNKPPEAPAQRFFIPWSSGSATFLRR